MQKIISVNLNNQAYQLDEPAYHLLQKYLEQARTKLSGDPDQDEVMHDFEQAIAEKCDQLLGANKNVVSTDEMKHIIEAMGPVETPDTEQSTHAAAAEPATAKRLYVLKEGAVVGGVCNGVAAYLNIDVTIVRLLFVVLAFVTGGFWALIYLAMMFVIPEAQTPEQKAELRGERFTANDLLHRAKQKYSDVSGKDASQIAQAAAPALSNAGQAVLKIFRAIAAIAVGLCAITIALTTMVLAVASWTILFGDVHLPDQLSTISTWTMLGTVAAGYVLVAIPIWFLASMLRRFASHKSSTKTSTHAIVAVIAAWMIALTALICMIVANRTQLSEYARTHDHHQVDSMGDCQNSVWYYDARGQINNLGCH